MDTDADEGCANIDKSVGRKTEVEDPGEASFSVKKRKRASLTSGRRSGIFRMPVECEAEGSVKTQMKPNPINIRVQSDIDALEAYKAKIGAETSKWHEMQKIAVEGTAKLQSEVKEPLLLEASMLTAKERQFLAAKPDYRQLQQNLVDRMQLVSLKFAEIEHANHLCREAMHAADRRGRLHVRQLLKGNNYLFDVKYLDWNKKFLLGRDCLFDAKNYFGMSILRANHSRSGTHEEEVLVRSLRFQNPEKFLNMVKMHLSRLLDLHVADEVERICAAFAGTMPAASQPASSKKRAFPLLSSSWQQLKQIVKGKNDTPAAGHRTMNVFGVALSPEINAHIYQLIEFLQQDDCLCEIGLFRKSGSPSRQQELRHLLSKGVTINMDLGHFSPHDVACVLKQFLRELPEPLLTDNHLPVYAQLCHFVRDDMLKCEAEAAANKQLTIVRLLIQVMPSENKQLLKDLLMLLREVSSRKSVNKMNELNLGTIFAPLLFSNKETSGSEIHSTAAASAKLIALVVKHAERIFKAPSCLVKDIQEYHAAKEKAAGTPGPSTRYMKNEESAAEINSTVRFVDEMRSATAANEMDMDLQVAELFANAQMMPDSAHKRKMIKKLQKYNQNSLGLNPDLRNLSVVTSNRKQKAAFKQFSKQCKRTSANDGDASFAPSHSSNVSSSVDNHRVGGVQTRRQTTAFAGGLALGGKAASSSQFSLLSSASSLSTLYSSADDLLAATRFAAGDRQSLDSSSTSSLRRASAASARAVLSFNVHDDSQVPSDPHPSNGGVCDSEWIDKDWIDKEWKRLNYTPQKNGSAMFGGSTSLAVPVSVTKSAPPSVNYNTQRDEKAKRKRKAPNPPAKNEQLEFEAANEKAASKNNTAAASFFSATSVKAGKQGSHEKNNSGLVRKSPVKIRLPCMDEFSNRLSDCATNGLPMSPQHCQIFNVSGNTRSFFSNAEKPTSVSFYAPPEISPASEYINNLSLVERKIRKASNNNGSDEKISESPLLIPSNFRRVLRPRPAPLPPIGARVSAPAATSLITFSKH